jgi:serine/threonine protein kinase
MDADRNLLFAVMALQGDLIDRDQFIEACTAWAAEKARPMAEVLRARGWITDEDRRHLQYLLDRKVQKHAGNAHESLLATADPNVEQALQEVQDGEVQRAMSERPRAAGHVLLSTIAYTPETRERYTLTRLHAQGGIGQVWLAKDGDLGRQVALKELRPERASNPAVWSRFLEEARITGQLEHPGIVPVYELSRRADDEAPFYTMRFVRGRTLSEAVQTYHARHKRSEVGPLDLHALLTAFVGVCQAIAYAHSRGVIHRDLKGQNVVLGDFGEVVVLDWGLAKLVGQPEAEQAAAPPIRPDPARSAHEPTLEGQALGTPGYMAPEQAEGRNDRIERRTDVYGLGAILYEILTGLPPIQGDDTATVLRRVIHEEPARPRTINPEAPAALEAICRKAIAKRPEDRYDSAEELARDVQRFLADEPVSVHRDPISTRLTRWGRRHRTAAVGAAALLSTAVVTLSIAAVRINQERARAERSFRQAREAVDDYFTAVSESKLLDVPGLQPLRRELLERAKSYYQSFLQQRGDDPAVRAEAAASLYRVADIIWSIGKKEDAIAPYTRALNFHEALVREHPEVTQYRVDLAMICNNLGNVYHRLGRTGDAISLQEKALLIRERLAREHPEGARYQNELSKSYSNLGVLAFDSGRQGEALAYLQRSRQIGEDLLRHPERTTALPTALGQRYNTPRTFRLDLAHDLYWISFLEFRLGRTDDSIRTLDQARGVYEALLKENPHDADVRGSLATATEDCGFHRMLMGRLDAAEPFLLRAHAIIDELADANPAVDSFRAKLAAIANDVGRCLREQGRLDQAMKHQQRALSVQQALVESHPGVDGYRWTLANIHREIGWLHRLQGRHDDALRAFAACREIDQKLPLSYADRYCELARDWALFVPPADPAGAPDERAAAEALAALRRAVEGGFHNADYLRHEPDLEPLRRRPEFQDLLTTIPRSAATAPQPTTTARN